MAFFAFDIPNDESDGESDRSYANYHYDYKFQIC